ncbi:MAG TPA: 3'-5' exonuclease, partial [Verrucomicrobiota bacterium]|nr:3'-5' exonuclease [Verrucomicrobiota bacterium]
IQGDLIDLLAAQHRNVMAVGDDAQSIYSWRGADFRNILEFPRRYPDARVFKIEVNYRSTPEVLAVANAVIRGNARQFPKELAAARRPGLKPVLLPCEDGHQQAAFVAQRMLELHEEGVPLRELAVLYRSHFHALELQLELTRRGIPFLITSGIRFFEQAHIKDVAAALKLLVNPADEPAFKRLVRLLPGIGGKGAEKLWKAFHSKAALTKPLTTDQGPVTEDEAPSSRLQAPSPVGAALMACAAAVPKKAAVAWAQLATTLAQLRAAELRDQPGRQIRLFLEAFYADHAEETFANARQRLDDLDELATYAAQFTTLTDFLTRLSLLNNLEADEEKKPAADDERVRLTTVHQAKGLEFAAVFVIMLGDGLFPGARSLDDPERIEEERRLFYVAVTRAKDELYLCHPLLRTSPGAGFGLVQRSRFLDEIPGELLDEWNLRPHAWDAPPAKQADGDEIPEGEQPF